MTLTFAQAKQHAILAVGGYPSLAPGQTRDDRLAEVVNQAGQYLFTNSGRFRERTTKYMNLVKDQNYITLPVDCEEILTVMSQPSLGYMIEMITPEHMEALRLIGLTISGPGITHAVMTRTPPANGAALPDPILDIYPTPTADATDAIAVRYRAKWIEIPSNNNGSWVIPIPPYVEFLFIAYVRAFAQAYEDEGLEQKLAIIDQSGLYNRALTKDGLLQRDFGRIRPSFDKGVFRYLKVNNPPA